MYCISLRYKLLPTKDTLLFRSSQSNTSIEQSFSKYLPRPFLCQAMCLVLGIQHWTECQISLEPLTVGTDRCLKISYHYITLHYIILYYGHGTTDWLQIGKGVHQDCMLSPCLLNLYTEYIIWNAGLDETQAGNEIAVRNINNLRNADDTTLMAESKEELKSLLMKVKDEKVGLKLNIQKTKTMACGPIISWQIDGETVEMVTDFIFLGSRITADGDCSHEIKRCLLLGRKFMTNLVSILKSRDITLLTKVHLVKAVVFPVVMYVCESWTIKLSTKELMLLNCGIGEDSWESLGLQGALTSQSGRKSALNIHLKDCCWSWMVGWHYKLNGHEFQQAPGVGEGQGNLARCSPRGRKESDTTEWLNWTKCYTALYIILYYIISYVRRYKALWRK